MISLDLPSRQRAYLLAFYDKDEKDDISPDEKKVLRALVGKRKEETK